MSLQLAEQFEANEQYEQALEEYKKEFAQNPQDIALLERLGHLSLILDRPDEAAEYYYAILQLDVSNSLAFEQLMSIYENKDRYKYYVYRGNKNSIEGKFEFAINDFKKALAHIDENEERQLIMTHLTLANLYLKTGKRDKAIDEFNLILEHDGVPEEVFLQLADVYLQDEAYSSAIYTLNKAKEKGYDNDHINEALAAVYLKSGEADKAIDCTKNELVKIQCLLEEGKSDEAREKLENLPEEYKKLPRYFTLMAQFAYTSKDFDKALEYIEEYNKVEQNSPLTYQMRALVYDETGDQYNSHLNWGRYNMLRGNNDVAINDFMNAVKIKDNDVNVLFTLADMLTEMKEINHAAEYYEKIIKIDSKNKEALRKLAQYKESIGDYASQTDYLEMLYVADKRDLAVLKDLAAAYEKIKSKQNAIDAYTKYLEMCNDEIEIKKAQDKLNRLQNLAGDSDESAGLIDKIMAFFTKK